jgi:hypothetical protein
MMVARHGDRLVAVWQLPISSSRDRCMQSAECRSGEALSASEILVRAERESGSWGLADDGLIARVTSLVDRINARGPYGPEQIRAMHEQILRVLVVRLRLAQDRMKFATIANEPIVRPLFIIGLARSGTTLLHSLLADDPDALKLESWHVYAPSPPPGAGPVVAGRISFAQRQVEAWSDFCPAQKVFHPYVDKGAFQLIEDEEIFSLDFRSAYPYHFYRVPMLDPAMALLSADQDGAFRFHRALLQHLQWNTGRGRWVCKGPSHQMNLTTLFAVYPDALCIWAHRPLGEIYASNVAIRAATYDAIQGRPVDWSSQAREHVERLKAAIDKLMASQVIDDPRIMHVSFREISSDPIRIVRKIYDRQGLEFSNAHEGRLKQWLSDPENASDRYGRYPYSYEAFGLDRTWVENLFADYSKRFGLK